MNNRTLAHFALAIVSMAYGANYIVAKGLMPRLIGPSGFIFIRVVGASILFWLLYALKREKIDRGDWWRLVACGITGVAVNQLLFFNGLNLTSPINASIIMTSNPILVLIASAVILQQKITKKKIAGIALGMVGALGLLLLSTVKDSVEGSTLGDLLVFINAMSYGIYLVLVKPLMAKYKPVTVITWVFTFGLVFVAPVGWSQFTQVDWSLFTNQDFGALAFVVLIVSFLVYLLNIFALKHLQPTTVSAYIYLQPLTAGLTAWIALWLGFRNYVDDITVPKLLFAALIFIGVYLVSSVKRSASIKPD